MLQNQTSAAVSVKMESIGYEVIKHTEHLYWNKDYRITQAFSSGIGWGGTRFYNDYRTFLFCLADMRLCLNSVLSNKEATSHM